MMGPPRNGEGDHAQHGGGASFATLTGPRETVKRARKLRSVMNLPETLLWQELRKRPGYFKFRRQHPAGRYILDFYCASVRLCIEVDGMAHNSLEVARRDERRSAWLRTEHVATLRIPAKTVLEDMASVVDRIAAVCKERAQKMQMLKLLNSERPLHHPSDGPPPRYGEDLL